MRNALYKVLTQKCFRYLGTGPLVRRQSDRWFGRCNNRARQEFPAKSAALRLISPDVCKEFRHKSSFFRFFGSVTLLVLLGFVSMPYRNLRAEEARSSSSGHGIAPGSGAFLPGSSLPGGLPATAGSSQRFLVTSAANEKGVFLWVIDAVDRDVTLCERTAGATEFSCSKHPLP